jgi:hypothetical protein
MTMPSDDGAKPRLPEDYFRRTSGARIYDYILGGKDNYQLDREAGDAALLAWPALGISMRANRAFMHRVARYLAAEAGLRQFLDIGTGLPTAPNLHEVVQGIWPEARIVYTDNDPIVLVHAQALLTSSPEGVTAYVQGDMREPGSIIDAPDLAATLDLAQPVGLTVIAMLHFIDDEAEAHRVLHHVLDRLPSGSYLALSTATNDFDPVPLAEVERAYRERGETLRHRGKQEVERFFEGLELVDPGVVQVHKWRPDAVTIGSVADKDVAMYGGVARKP